MVCPLCQHRSPPEKWKTLKTPLKPKALLLKSQVWLVTYRLCFIILNSWNPYIHHFGWFNPYILQLRCPLCLRPIAYSYFCRPSAYAPPVDPSPSTTPGIVGPGKPIPIFSTLRNHAGCRWNHIFLIFGTFWNHTMGVFNIWVWVKTLCPWWTSK